MTETELTILRLRMKVVARDIALQMLLPLLPHPEAWMPPQAEWEKSIQDLADPWPVPTAAESQLYSQEWQEAVREVFQQVEQELQKARRQHP